MRYYPIFLDLAGKHCLVVGAGPVGARKVATLLDCGPERLTVVDPNPPSKDMAALVGRHGLSYEQRAFRDEDLADKWLVVAATGNQDLNWRIANLCKDNNVPCNVVDQPEAGSFIVPATLSQGDLTLAVSTSGASPALARKIRRDLEELFGSQYAAFLVVMARLRPLLIELGLPNGDNATLFRAVVGSELMDILQQGDLDRAAATLAQLLPEELHPKIPEMLHDLP